VVTSLTDTNVAEFAALNGSIAMRPATGDHFGLTLPLPDPGAVFIGGIALPFVNQTTRPAGISAGPVGGTGAYLPGHGPTTSQGQPPEGDLIPITNGPIGGL